ncbi:MAG: ABC transporter permease [Gammaproteobacteria bacterium]|nr:ABC transporter permease [Gammaproteobacteria bacterium]
MRALDKKVLRELWQMRGQALAIIAVIVSGVTTMVMFLSTYDSLIETRENYYAENRFAEVFASLKRAPEHLLARIQVIPGVERAESRVVAAVNLDIEGFNEPVIGKLISLPDAGDARLNQLHLRRGRFIEPYRDDEVMLSEAFANAHRLQPGDHLSVIIKGKRKTLTIVGIVLSPEYVYQIAPGAFFPDFKRYGVMWMGRNGLASAYDMDGAFNDISLTLGSGAAVGTILDQLDDLLKPYGGYGAYAREDQFSHRFLSEEVRQLRTMATVFPLIFIGVAAFLLNVVLNRLINTQREQIAILKAFGYSNAAIGLHFVKLVLLIVLLGITIGVALGGYWGRELSLIYMEFYRFPYLHYLLRPSVVVVAATVTVLAAISGTLLAVRQAARLSPAEGMRPNSPVVYRASLIERLGLQRFFSQPTRMIVRHIQRRPFKSLLSVIGIALAGGIMMVGNFQEDAIRYMVEVQFSISKRDDLSVRFTDPTSRRALHELQAIPGVQHVEVFRTLPVRLRFEHRTYRTALEGVQPEGELMRVLDTRLQPVALPPQGVVLTDHLAKILGVLPGDMLTIEVLEESQPVLQVPVVGLSKQYLGVWGYMRIDALNRVMGEGEVISGAYLAVDPQARGEIYAQLKEMPRVAGIVVRKSAIQSFYDTMAETVLFFSFIANLLGATIAVGVVYNTARIALSERGRELASLRVLGFTHGEIAYILLGELVLLTLVAIPLGFLVGEGLCAFLASQFKTDLYRVPLVLESQTYANAAAVVLFSACASGAVIWHRLGRIDLVSALKTRE